MLLNALIQFSSIKEVQGREKEAGTKCVCHSIVIQDADLGKKNSVSLYLEVE